MLESKKIHVGELRVGMYVCKLDRDWLETPFLMQGFTIEDSEDIDIVAEYCEYVWVNARLYKPGMVSREAASSPAGGYATIRTLSNSVSAMEENRRSYKTFRKARSITKTLLDDIRLGGALDGEAVKETVSDCVNSILRNPDALLWMTKIREENEYTSEHCLNVCILAITFGRFLGLDEGDLEKIGLCGLLHDVGKMRVPAEILDKPGALTDKERKIMQAHTVHGRNLLLSSGSVYPGAIDAAYSHHERVDGEGYPRKLSAAGISYFSKIVAIVDAYDAMTANRCYARAVTSTEALKRIYESRGSHFDEKLALQFIKAIGLFPAGSVVELYSGEVAIVVETNLKRRHLPKLLVVRTSAKELCEERVIDLRLVEKGELPKNSLIKKVWPDGTFGVYLREYQENGFLKQK